MLESEKLFCYSRNLYNTRGTMATYYFWNEETYEYSYSEEYPENRIPPTGTTKEPLTKEGYKTIWNPKEQTWVYLNKKEFTEHKIQLGLLQKGENVKVNEEGELVPMTELELIQEGKLSLETIRQRKIAEVNRKAKELIEGGFVCNALGENYVYDTSLEDQFNIKSLLDLGLKEAEIRCRKEGSSQKEFVLHTKAQIAKIVQDFAKYKMEILRKAHEMKVEISSINNTLAVYEYLVNFDLWT
ncbi:MAG: hypothetical protein N3A69_05740 [Leptospiraceae bacterium]|nr:hypothetical protein [Leptospiraceae bacterium]